jgi:hypothetical protein
MGSYASTAELVEAVGALLGVDALSAQMDADLAAKIGTRLDERLRQAWQREMWPFACVYSWRQFAADWAVGTTYAAGAAVLASDNVYYISQAGTNLANDPVADDGTWWLSVTRHAGANPDYEWMNLIERNQAWAEEWHECSRVWASNPLSDPMARELRPLPSPTGMVVHPSAGGCMRWEVPARVVALVRPWPPRVGCRPWEAQAYAAGALVYHGGESYVAASAAASGDVPGTAALWAVQRVPRDLKPFVVHAAYADMLRSQGQIEHAFTEGRVAASILDDIVERVLCGQQQVQRAMWMES